MRDLKHQRGMFLSVRFFGMPREVWTVLTEHLKQWAPLDPWIGRHRELTTVGSPPAT